ncbi:MAG: alpha/beta hydrolase [Planctomycetota bacterium]
MNFLRLTVFVLVIFHLVTNSELSAQTSNSDQRLKEALRRFPQADADRDGILTLREAKLFRNKMLEGQPNQPAGNKSGKGRIRGDKRIYKKIAGVELPLYIFRPANHRATSKAPAIVFFFGGGWRTGDPKQFEGQCKYLADRGMVAITVDYRVSSRHDVKIEDCVEDAKSAMRWVRSNAGDLGIDPNRIASGGGSAGGHLAACVGMVDSLNSETDDLDVSSKPNAMVLFNPGMALAMDDHIPERVARVLAEKRANKGADLLRTHGDPKVISPLAYAEKKQPPMIMFFGTKDPGLLTSKIYADVTRKAGNECRLITYEGQSHGFFNNRKEKYFDLTLQEVDKFLVSLDWLEPDA